MAFKLITVLCATLAFAHGGLLPAAYSPANEVSQVYSSIGSIAPQPALIARANPLYAAQAAQVVAGPVIAAPAVAAVKSYAAASPIYSSPIAKIAYSPANEVSSVYSSIAAPSYAYGAQAAAVGTSQQSTIRSLGGTISSYSKAVDTPFSSVRKSDTRISNNYYTPALATKTIAYQQPAYIEQKTIPATVVSHVTFDGLGTHYAW